MENTDGGSSSSSRSSRSSSSSSKQQRWIVGELIGRGAFASVYAARDAKTGEHVAIKRIRTTTAGDGEAPAAAGSAAANAAELKQRALRQLAKEVELLRTFSHPHIVRYLGTQRSSKEFYIVMERVRGGSVTQWLHDGCFSEAVALRFAGQMFRGLAYLHSKGVIHRDIKGANLLVDGVASPPPPPPPSSADAPGGDAPADAAARMDLLASGRVKIADFGSARLLQHGATLEESVSTMHGTTYWMAPEVVRGDQYGRRCDVWSGGCVLLEMLTGKPPWHTKLTAAGMNQFAAMFHIASSGEPPPMEDVANEQVRELLLRCFVRDAQKRPSAADLLADDVALLGGADANAPMPTEALADQIEELALSAAAPSQN